MKSLFCRPNIRAPLPWCVKEHGVLKFLLPKIAHYLTDFHSSWFPSLNLPPSDGKHKQLLNCHFEALYRRLEPLPGGRGEIGVHSSLYVGHKAFLGNQIVHCSHRGASPCTLHAHYAHYAHFSKLARPPKIKL